MESFEVKITNISDNYLIECTYNIENRSFTRTAALQVSPTNNCQMMSIAGFNNFMIIDNIKDFLYELFKKLIYVKNAVLIDVNSNIYDRIANSIKGCTIFTKKYTNLTGNTMVITYINLNKYIKKHEKNK